MHRAHHSQQKCWNNSSFQTILLYVNVTVIDEYHQHTNKNANTNSYNHPHQQPQVVNDFNRYPDKDFCETYCTCFIFSSSIIFWILEIKYTKHIVLTILIVAVNLSTANY